MKKQTGIWMDTSKAIIITFNDGQEHVQEIESNVENRIHHEGEGDKGSFMGSQRINHESTLEERKKHFMDHYFDDVISHIKDSDELFVFGPAEAKTKFKQRIVDHSSIPENKIIAIETADKMTLNQAVAKVKHFYAL